jgi:small subunit ribosomal protein S16
LETLGWYDPKREGENYKLDLDRVAFWKARGAQMSETVASLVRKNQRVLAKA